MKTSASPWPETPGEAWGARRGDQTLQETFPWEKERCLPFPPSPGRPCRYLPHISPALPKTGVWEPESEGLGGWCTLEGGDGSQARGEGWGTAAHGQGSLTGAEGQPQPREALCSPLLLPRAG